MKSILFVLLAITFRSFGQETIDKLLLWDANPEPDLMEYRLYVGTNDTGYGPPIKVLTNSKVLFLPKVMHWAKVTAVNTSGLESLPSNVLVFQVFTTGEGLAPSAPMGLRIGPLLSATIQRSDDLRLWSTLHTQPILSHSPQSFYRLVLHAP